MRKYESVIVFDPSLSEADLKEEVKKIQKILEGAKASNIASDIWGKKEIAYLVKRNKYGHFVCITFESDEPTTTSELTRMLGITERVIKFQTHRIQERKRQFKGNPKKTTQGKGSYGDDFFVGDEAY